MKILFYNHTGKVSGAERVLLMILQGLDRQRFQSALICPVEGPLQRLATEMGVACHPVSILDARFTIRPDRLIKYLYSFVVVLFELRRQITAFGPDLVHANSIRSGLVATLATLGTSTRVVWHLHDLLPRHPLSMAIRCFAFLFARAPMIAVTQAVADNFAGRLFSLKNRIHVILNGIDIDRFVPGDTARKATRDQLGVQPEDFAVGIVGLLTPRKGQLGLIRAFEQVARRVDHARLFIVGGAVFNRDSDYETLLRSTISDLNLADRVSFLGERDDVPALMHAFDVLVVNSSVEPFGLVVAEGLAAMTPVVATATGGIPEVIQHGRNGWLVSVGDTHELAEGIIVFARNSALRQSIVSEGRSIVETKFSLARYVQEMQAFYESQKSLIEETKAEANDLRTSRLVAE